MSDKNITHAHVITCLSFHCLFLFCLLPLPFAPILSLSLSTCSLSCSSTSMSSEPPRIQTTALTHTEEYCTVAIHNPLTLAAERADLVEAEKSLTSLKASQPGGVGPRDFSQSMCGRVEGFGRCNTSDPGSDWRSRASDEFTVPEESSFAGLRTKAELEVSEVVTRVRKRTQKEHSAALMT